MGVAVNPGVDASIDLAVGSGRFIPTLIVVMMMDLGTFAGTEGNNRFGPATEPVKFR